MADYWGERAAKAQANLTAKSVEATNKQLAKYYADSMRKIIGQFKSTYNKVISSIDEGKEPTPADLYKLDSYWQLQAQLQQELRKLGEIEIALLGQQFEKQYRGIYESLAEIDGSKHFSSIDTDTANQMINQIWCADGKSWSDRVWDNTSKLQQDLNDNLIHCVVSGKKTSELKNLLQANFGASYSRADALVRTEMAHIQTQAARQRYKDYGLTEVQIWADYDERRCDICGNLHKKRYSIDKDIPIPAHPRCRCCVIPVVEGDEEKSFSNVCVDCGTLFETYNEKTEICPSCQNARWRKYRRLND